MQSYSFSFLLILILSLVMAIVLNFTMFLCTIVNSALTTTIVGVLKGVGSTVSWEWFGVCHRIFCHSSKTWILFFEKLGNSCHWHLLFVHLLFVFMWLITWTTHTNSVSYCFFRPLVSSYWVVFKSMHWMCLDWLSIQLVACGTHMLNISRKKVRQWS